MKNEYQVYLTTVSVLVYAEYYTMIDGILKFYHGNAIDPVALFAGPHLIGWMQVIPSPSAPDATEGTK